MLDSVKTCDLYIGGAEMLYEVIVDNEWYYEGSFEKCCDMVDEINADPDFWGSCDMMSEEEFGGEK